MVVKLQLQGRITCADSRIYLTCPRAVMSRFSDFRVAKIVRINQGAHDPNSATGSSEGRFIPFVSHIPAKILFSTKNVFLVGGFGESEYLQ